MKRLIYRYPFLFALLLFLPVAAFLVALVGPENMGPGIYIPLTLYAFLALSYPGAWAARALQSEAHRHLEAECDPVAFLDGIEFLLKHKKLSPRRRLLLSLDYAVGLDSLGRHDEALSAMRSLPVGSVALNPLELAVIEGDYGVMSLHGGCELDAIPDRIRKMELVVASVGLPATVTRVIGDFIADLRDAYHLEIGQYDGLLDRYIARVEAFRGDPSRRRFLTYCMALAKLYDRLGRKGEAISLYGYVAKNGNRLGIVKKAEEARIALLNAPADGPAPSDGPAPADEGV